MLPLVNEEELILMLSSVKCCYRKAGWNKFDCGHSDCNYKGTRNELILKFLYSTGARVSEICKLKI